MRPGSSEEEDARSAATYAHRILGEREWLAAGRPYYNIWPSMIDPLASCNLTGILGGHIQLPVPYLLLRFPRGQGTAFVHRHRDILLITRNIHPNPVTGLMLVVGDLMPLSGMIEGAADNVAKATLSTVAALSMIRDNPDIIQPIPLTRDAQNYEKTLDPALIEKAKRRGLNAFNVGRHIEAAPGFRKPHFAIRWKGKGRVNPTLVPVKGCMVRRQIITEVPTGYLDEDEAP